MIFITGGESQGKRRFAADVLGAVSFADGSNCGQEDIEKADCLTSFHLFIRRIMESGGDPVDYTEKLCRKRPELIVIMNEIGCGIVPIDKDERIWRENVGRCGCIIAANSELAVRMVCGIPTVLKGELP